MSNVAKTASKLDPSAAHAVSTLKARGPRIVPALLEVVQQRAEAAGEDLSDACSKLPTAWQATILLAHVLERFEAGAFIPEIVRDLAEVDDRSLIIAALKEIREPELAKKFLEAEDLVDEKERMWSGYESPDSDSLLRLHKKIFALVGAMDEPFPAAD